MLCTKNVARAILYHNIILYLYIKLLEIISTTGETKIWNSMVHRKGDDDIDNVKIIDCVVVSYLGLVS